MEEPADTIRARALRREANSLYGVYLELCEHPAQTVQLRMLASESSRLYCRLYRPEFRY